MQYTVKGTRKRHFGLLNQNGEEVAALDFKHLLSRRTAYIHYGGREISIGPEGLLKATLLVKESETVKYRLRFSIKGLKLKDDAGTTLYNLRRVGFFGGHFGLFSPTKHEIVRVKQHFVFSEWSFSYDIDADDNYAEGKDPVFLLLLVFCVNYLHMQQSAAT